MHTPEHSQSTFEQLDPEFFWSTYGAQIEDELRTMATKGEEFNQSWFEWAVKSERQFATQVLTEAKRMQQETGVEDALVLFDVDETLASAHYTGDGLSFITVLRPSADKVFSKLKEAKLGVGFLTSRTSAPLKQELENGSMKPLDKHRSPEHFYTRETEHAHRDEMRSFDAKAFSEHFFELFGGPDSFFDEEKVKQSETYKKGWWQVGAMSRLQIIKKIRGEIKGPFMVVDDLEYPHLLTGKNGVYGVELDKNSKFFSAK